MSSLKKLKGFYDLVKDTPSEIHDTLYDIETLHFITEEIKAIARSEPCLPNGLHTVLLRSAKRCLDASNTLRSIIDDIDTAMKKRKLPGAVKGALKKGKLDELRKRLESTKTTWLVASHALQRHRVSEIQCYVARNSEQAVLLQKSFLDIASASRALRVP